MGKRENNKAKVQKRLLKEARILFTVQGLEGTTVAEIVAAAEIARGTFYNYFTDVKDIFTAVVEAMNIDIDVAVHAARSDATSIYELFYLSFKGYFDFVSQPDMINFYQKNQMYIRNAAYNTESVRRIIKDIQALLQSRKGVGDFNEPHEIQLLSIILLGTPIELFLNLNNMKMDISNHDLATFLAKLFTKGVKID